MSRTRLRRALLLAALGALILAVGLAAGAVLLAPVTEKMRLEGGEVEISYTPSASAEELLLSFYPGATVEDSFIYRVTSAEGKRVLYHASARLLSADSPEKAAAFYHDKLPGRPEAVKVEDEAGKRWVLAVATADEVRSVTISATEGKTRIELLRTSRPAPPARPIKPRRRERVI
jgi:hypothetical protein